MILLCTDLMRKRKIILKNKAKIQDSFFFFLPLIIYNLQRSHRFSPLISYHRIYPNLNSIGISEVRWWFAQASNLRVLLDRLFSYMSRPWGFTSFYIMRSRNVIRCKFSNWNKVLGNADGKYQSTLGLEPRSLQPTVNRPTSLALRLPLRHIDLGRPKTGTNIYPSNTIFFFFSHWLFL